MGANTVRIIAGQWRRRLLHFPEAEGLRPTPDRVRETLFNWLGQTLDGRICLDLFAGSGALGFEAASRGASEVILVERAPKVAKSLEDNVQLLDAGRVMKIVRADAVEFASSLRASGRRFDVIFLDPPYNKGWLERVMPLVQDLLADDGMLYIEAEQALDGWGSLRSVRDGRAGQVYYHLMQKEGMSDGA